MGRRIATALLAWGKRFSGEFELARLLQWVPRNRPAVDIGAGRGVYTWFLRRLVPVVHAVEPDPHLAERRRRAFPEVAVYAIALSDDNGGARSRSPRSGDLGADGCATLEKTRRFESLGPVDIEEIDVPVVTLDALGLSDVGFLKIDLIGNELAVLRCATETLRRCRPTILVEAGKAQQPEIAKRLAPLGYRLERARAPFMFLARPQGRARRHPRPLPAGESHRLPEHR